MDGTAGTTEATFLFADLAGFTALTEAHGDQDAANCAARFYQLARAALVPDARIVKTIGDAVMIVAGQPTTAVTIALQLAAALEAEPGFPVVRAGLHAGVAIKRMGDYFGATVNLAARVTAHARSGQVLCTQPVAEAIRDLTAILLQPIGLAHFKNVAQPVALFEIVDAHRTLANQTIDPVCKMHLDPNCAPARLPFGERIYYFCSFACAQTFAHSPDAYLRD